MNQSQARAAVQTILGGSAPEAQIQKTASPAPPAVPSTPDEWYNALGKEAFVRIYEDAHEKLAAVELENAMEKVAMLLRDDAARTGRLAGFVKQAAPNDPDLQEVLFQVLTSQE